jgi:hypothetical protein
MKTYLDKIEAMRELPPNWDSYGADPMNPEVLRDAAAFLRSFVASTGIGEPQVAPTRVGGVAAFWGINGHELEMDFERNETQTLVTYQFEDTKTGETVGGDFGLGESADFQPIGLRALAKAMFDTGVHVAI